MVSTMNNIPLFSSLGPEALDLIESLFEPCLCHEGMIFEQGDPAIYLYLVIEGSVDILFKPYDGSELIVTSVKSGEIFGWSAITGNTNYTSGARCVEQCQAIRIKGSALRELCIQHPDTGSVLLDRLAESVSGRWHDARLKVRDILSQGVIITPENLEKS